jgi:hypothetical protein
MIKRSYLTLREAFEDIDKMVTLGFINNLPTITSQGSWEVIYL